MRKLGWAVGLLLLVACGKKEESSSSSSSSSSGSGSPPWKASTPEEFFESYKAAHVRKDAAAVLKNAYTKNRRADLTKSAESMLELYKQDKEKAKKHKEEFGLDKNPAEMTAEELLEAITRGEMEQDPREYSLINAMSESAGSYSRFVIVQQKKTKGGQESQRMWELRFEDGAFRIEKDGPYAKPSANPVGDALAWVKSLGLKKPSTPEELTSTKFLSLSSNKKVTDDGLVHLKTFFALKTLNLDNTSVTAKGLAHLGSCKLDALDLSGLKLGDDLGSLKECWTLKKLNLSDTGISDAGLETLPKLSSLEELYISYNSRVTDAGMHSVGKQFNLRSLSLWETGVSSAGLAELKKLGFLRELGLAYTKVTDEGLAHIAELPALESLNLGNTAVADAGLENLAKCKKLKNVQLTGTRVTDKGLAHVAAFPALESIDLSHTGVTDAGLENLGRCKSLKRVSLTGTKSTKDGIDKLKSALPGCEIEM